MLNRRLFLLELAAASGGALLGCSSAPGSSGSKPAITMGSTNFSEQLIVAELYAQALEAAGYTVTRKFNLGSREIVAPALASGQIDMYPEYLASYLTFLTNDPTKASPDPGKTYAALQEAAKVKNVTALQYAPAQDENGFVVTQATASEKKLTKISDLAAFNGQLVLGGPPECPQRPFCLQGLEKVYGLKFKDFKALDTGGPLTVAALQGKQIDVGELFTSDAAIAANNFVLLQDDKGLQLADNLVPVVRTAIVNQAPADFATTVNGVSTKLTTSELTALNKQVGLDKKDPKDVAGPWLKAQGLVK
jgi:glycine betaine/choline ABC-type transport system substrate-binding protein